MEEIALSHPNLDHFSGVPAILRHLDVERVTVNRYFLRRGEGTAERRLAGIVHKAGVPWKVTGDAPRVWIEEGVRFECLWPPADLEAYPVNDTSTVWRITYRGRSMLLTGDIEERAERALLQRGDLRADVLVLPHHGGLGPASASFFQAVGASVWIRSGSTLPRHRRGTLERLAGSGTVLMDTAEDGAVEVCVTESAFRVTSFRGSARLP
ncbi:MAG: MBL fold metallo-hydrolase [Planctomycetota bacterium]|nr:MAG: MBL fold metallo-hydrolase [Planctomycetota bacterium]